MEGGGEKKRRKRNLRKNEWSRWGKDRGGEQGEKHLDVVSHYGASKKPGARETPRNSHDEAS